MAKTSGKSYVCTTGIDSGDVRMERGNAYTGPTRSIAWLAEQGHIVEADSDEATAIAAELAAFAPAETDSTEE